MSAHRILGVTPDASPEEIRRAYRRLALTHHPDHAPGDPSAGARFREIHAAYCQMSADAGASRVPAEAPFEPLVAEPVRGMRTMRLPLAHAIAGVRASIGGDGARLSADVPPGCGAGVVLTCDCGTPVRIAHLIPARFRATADDLEIAVEADSNGPLAGRISFLAPDDTPVVMSLGAQPPAELRLAGWGLPRSGAVGQRGDLLVTVRMRARGPEAAAPLGSRLDVHA